MRADPWSFMLSSGKFISHLHVSEVFQQYNRSAPKLKFSCANPPERGAGKLFCHSVVTPPMALLPGGDTDPPPSAPVGSLSSQNIRVAFLLHFISTSWTREPMTSLNILMQRPSPPSWDKPPGAWGRGSKERRAGRSRSWKYKYEVEFEICFWAALSCCWVAADDNARQL